MTTVYPATPVPLFGDYEIEETWRVLQTPTESGNDLRRKKWSSPRREWTLRYRSCAPAEFDQIIKFWSARSGAFEAFEFLDFQASLHCGISIGAADGTVRCFATPLDTAPSAIYLDGVELTLDIDETRFRNLLALDTADLEAGIGDWVPNQGATVTRTSLANRSGTFGLRVTTPGVVEREGGTQVGNTTLLVVGGAAEGPITGSAWVKGSGTVEASLQWFTAGPTFDSRVDGTAVTLDGTWQRVTVTGTPPAGVVSVSLLIGTNSAQAVTFDVDDAQLEHGSSASGWFAPGTGPLTHCLTAAPAAGALTMDGTGRRLYEVRFRPNDISYQVDGFGRISSGRVGLIEVR